MDLRELVFEDQSRDWTLPSGGAASADAGIGSTAGRDADPASVGASGAAGQSTSPTKIVDPATLVGDIVVLAGLSSDVRVGDSIVDLQVRAMLGLSKNGIAYFFLPGAGWGRNMLS